MLPKVVYHLAEQANWESIQQLGLLSASKLMDLAHLAGPKRVQFESFQRLTHQLLPTGVEIRDQRPLPANALAKCLIGLKPVDWYHLINARAFCWFDADRLNRQFKACSPRPQIVLTIALTPMLEQYQDIIEFTPINTGNARRLPAKRGRATFVPYRTWQESRWNSETTALGTPARLATFAPVELTIRDGIPNIMDFVLKTTPLSEGEEFQPEG